MSQNLTLATRVKAARKNAGYKTAKSFIESHHYPHSTYMQYETGRRNPNDDVIKKLAKEFKVNFDWLKFGHGSPLKAGKSSTILDGELLDLKAEAIKPEEINEALLAKILEQLLKLSEKNTISIKKTASAASHIYSDITKCEPDPKIQLKLVSPAITIYERHAL